MNQKGQGLFMMGGLIVLFILFLAFVTCTAVVPAGNVGVQDTLGVVSNDLLGPGFYFKSPITGVHVISLQTQLYNVEAGAASKNLQTVKTTVGINYHLESTRVIEIYKRFKDVEVEKIIMYPATQETLKANTALFNADELIGQRPVITKNLNDALKERFIESGIIVETVNTTDFKFGEEFDRAIEEKQVAQQAVEKARYELQQAEIEAQKIAATARGNADAMKISADAQAYQLEVINSKLTQNPLLLEYKALEKWNGVLPKVTGGATPFIDVSVLE